MTVHQSHGTLICSGCGPAALARGQTQDGRPRTLEDRQQALLLVLRAHGGWMSAKEMEDDVWLDWHPGTAGAPLLTLKRAGLVRSTPGPERRLLWRLT